MLFVKFSANSLMQRSNIFCFSAAISILNIFKSFNIQSKHFQRMMIWMAMVCRIPKMMISTAMELSIMVK